jgi:hypothetical protein
MGNPGPDPDEEDELRRRRALRTKSLLSGKVVEFDDGCKLIRSRQKEAETEAAHESRRCAFEVGMSVLLTYMTELDGQHPEASLV